MTKEAFNRERFVNLLKAYKTSPARAFELYLEKYRKEIQAEFESDMKQAMKYYDPTAWTEHQWENFINHGVFFLFNEGESQCELSKLLDKQPRK